MYPTKLTVPKVEISFDTPNRDRFLRDEFPGRSSYTVLGRGSYGVVIKARYKGKSVAVKILEKHKKHRCRFDSIQNESNILNLKHENIVRVLKIISSAQYGLVIMERFDGHCLQSILNQSYAISIYHRLLILCDIINGLWFCHRHHIVHLDLKPQNVIVCLLIPDALTGLQCKHVRNYMCKLCDFGSSIVLNTSKSDEKPSNKGTIRYMAPELLRGMGNITEVADIYSFGVTMWQLNEGKHPYHTITSNEAVAYNVVKKRIRPDSVTSVENLRSGLLMTPSGISPLMSGRFFRSRKNSDTSMDVSRSIMKPIGNSQMSFHSSILISSTVSGQQTSIECAAAAMRDVLEQQGIDLVETPSVPHDGSCEQNSDDATGNADLNAAALDALFVHTVDVDPVDQSYIRQEYRTLYRKCWQHDATLRPAASDVRLNLHSMLERICCCK
ncbi:probable serine/threonine-protein kinase gdt4 [Toxorhynchites rutilus septentrionalis]|uniref:probable serine/threonine-protein kinase gdt4 n=1 Tax=Toxorhynchites rutilus septentrionalis TaxID=329112 RepID=UPI002478EB8A|nr:probable serine/threonine-protein kinase gdt4 [Toxorhynchites rutilus septentrionalis]